jgi:regulator of replication initiation timing
MNIEDKIKALRKQLEELNSINYEMVESNGHLCIRDGKYRVMTCFSKELGNAVLESLKSTIASHITILERALSDLDSRYSEIQHSLFGKE